MNRVPRAFAASDVQVRQELHLDLLQTVTLARFATAAFDVETEAAGTEATLFGLARAGEHFADLVKRADVRRRRTARRASDGTLVDLHHLVDLRRAAQAAERSRLGRQAAQTANHRRRQRLVDQRTLARTADAGDTDQRFERETRVDIVQVVGRDAFDR